MYVDRAVTYNSTGKVRLFDLFASPNFSPAFTSLVLIFPATNAGQVGVGDSQMAALPADAYNPGENTTYPTTTLQNCWDLSQIYLWFQNAGDVVNVRGNSLC